jgi:hypothetical protein
MPLGELLPWEGREFGDRQRIEEVFHLGIGHESWLNLVGLGLPDLGEGLRVEQLAGLDQPLSVTNTPANSFLKNRFRPGDPRPRSIR